jgi:hypothetical protein
MYPKPEKLSWVHPGVHLRGRQKLTRIRALEAAASCHAANPSRTRKSITRRRPTNVPTAGQRPKTAGPATTVEGSHRRRMTRPRVYPEMYPKPEKPPGVQPAVRLKVPSVRYLSGSDAGQRVSRSATAEVVVRRDCQALAPDTTLGSPPASPLVGRPGPPSR